jgi:hypothetical protein
MNLDDSTTRQIVAEYVAGTGSTTIGRKHGCPAAHVLTLVRRAGHRVRTKVEARALVHQPDVYEPSPEEIAERAAEVRRGWTRKPRCTEEPQAPAIHQYALTPTGRHACTVHPM